MKFSQNGQIVLIMYPFKILFMDLLQIRTMNENFTTYYSLNNCLLTLLELCKREIYGIWNNCLRDKSVLTTV